MLDIKSDYALNKKDKNCIIYRGNDGYESRLTRENFSSEEEFQFWKSWSDENYRLIDNADTYYRRHIVNLYTVDGQIASSSLEESLINEIEHMEQIEKNKEIISIIKSIISQKQFRRIWFHYALHLKVRIIAKIEGVTHPSIVNSIVTAKKKILSKARS